LSLMRVNANFQLISSQPTSIPVLYKSKFAMSTSAWHAPRPCEVGCDLSGIDTPALIVDLDALDVNLQHLPDVLQAYPGVHARPHAKAHKSPDIAKLQMDHGAIGLCTQTLVESEALVYGGGTKDVFLTNQLIGQAKLERFAKLAKEATVSICVDNKSNLLEISEVATAMGVNVDCVVEVNVGQNRCGVEPGEPAAELAEEIQKCSGITFKGIHCYHGWNQHVRATNDRAAAVQAVVDKVNVTLKSLKDRGIGCEYVTGGGTGSFVYEAKSGVYTEVQPGSYIFMDGDYAQNLDDSGVRDTTWKHSLYVLTTVQSVTGTDRAVVDAGMKAVSMDSGVPWLVEHPDLTYHVGGDEHGIIKPAGKLQVGDRLHLIPGHCDPTANMYDWIVGVRNGRVEAVWPITGRGPGV